jgi:hypothetical protein
LKLESDRDRNPDGDGFFSFSRGYEFPLFHRGKGGPVEDFVAGGLLQLDVTHSAIGENLHP